METLTECCEATTTYMDDFDGGWVLCCKSCCAEVEVEINV